MNWPRSSHRVSQPGHLHSPCPYRGWEPGVSSWEELGGRDRSETSQDLSSPGPAPCIWPEHQSPLVCHSARCWYLGLPCRSLWCLPTQPQLPTHQPAVPVSPRCVHSGLSVGQGVVGECGGDLRGGGKRGSGGGCASEVQPFLLDAVLGRLPRGTLALPQLGQVRGADGCEGKAGEAGWARLRVRKAPLWPPGWGHRGPQRGGAHLVGGSAGAPRPGWAAG